MASARNANTKTTPPETGSQSAGFSKVSYSAIDRTPEVGLAGIGLLAMLRKYAKSDPSCYPSVATLAEKSGADQKTVRSLVRKLEAVGFVVVEYQPGGSNLYHLPDIAPTERSGENGRAPEMVSKKRQGTPGKNGRGPLPKFPPYVDKSYVDKPADAERAPAGLLELIDGWNAFGDQIVKRGNGARRDPPSQAAVKGWNRAARNSEQREGFKDIPRVLTAIRSARYCHCQDWFTVPWLFGTNKNHEFNITKILNGGHDGKARPNGTGQNGRSGGTMGNQSPSRHRTRNYSNIPTITNAES